MSKGNQLVKKRDLPEKICVVCKKPFKWRKKWAKCWNEVKYCSQNVEKADEKYIYNITTSIV